MLKKKKKSKACIQSERLKPKSNVSIYTGIIWAYSEMDYAPLKRQIKMKH